jgi:hypothetical protein
LRAKPDLSDENSDTARVVRASNIGSSLYFYRAAGVLGQWKLGPIAGYGIIPSIGVDPGWFVDQVRGATSNRAEVDPLEKYRADSEW